MLADAIRDAVAEHFETEKVGILAFTQGISKPYRCDIQCRRFRIRIFSGDIDGGFVTTVGWAKNIRDMGDDAEDCPNFIEITQKVEDITDPRFDPQRHIDRVIKAIETVRTFGREISACDGIWDEADERSREIEEAHELDCECDKCKGVEPEEESADDEPNTSTQPVAAPDGVVFGPPIGKTYRFEKIDEAGLREKIEEAAGAPFSNAAVLTLLQTDEQLIQDLSRVEFKMENLDCEGQGDNGQTGFQTFSKDFTALCCSAGGNKETPVYFVVSWSGDALRAYIPVGGNPWNTDRMAAYGVSYGDDLEHAQKRWPDKTIDDLKDIPKTNMIEVVKDIEANTVIMDAPPKSEEDDTSPPGMPTTDLTPADILFSVHKCDDGNGPINVAIITPEYLWQRDQCVADHYEWPGSEAVLKVLSDAGYCEMMDSTFEPSTKKSEADVKQDMLNMGFKYDKSFDDFVQSC